MKYFYTNMKKIAGLAAMSMLIAAGLASCDTSGLTDTLDEFGVLVQLEPINTSATVQLIDAASGELINSDVTATFGGENGSDIIDIYSDPIDQREIGDGILNFGIDNSVTPSESNPAEIQLQLQANGYVSASKTIAISNEGDNNFTIQMVNENNRPQGVTSTTSSEGSTDEQGTVENNFSVSSDSDTEADAGTSIEVESGTTFKDADGNNLTGQLTTSLSYYTPSEVSAMSSLPVEFEDENGNTIVIAGASEISITDQNGRRAATAELSGKASNKSNNDGPSYIFKIPSSAINPNTGTSYKVGDEVTVVLILEREDQNGVSWFQSSTSGTVQEIESANGTSFLGVKYSTPNIPVASMVGVPLNEVNSCEDPILSGNWNEEVYATIGTLYTAGYSLDFGFGLFGLSTKTIYGTIPDQLLSYTFLLPGGGILTGQANLCTGEGLPIDMPDKPANMIDATVEVGLICEEGQVTVTDVPSASILYRRAGDEFRGSGWRAATNIEWDQDEANNDRIEGGSFDVSSVIDGEDYVFTIKIDDENRTRTVTIDGDPTTYTEEVADICE